MGLCISTTSRYRTPGRIGRVAIRGSQRPRSNDSCTATIHVLDDDSLLHVFYLYRPFLLGEDRDDDARLWGGDEGWVRGRWWYNLAHVCQRWRFIILGSTSYLGISLVCTEGTPVADMLAHSPPLPLVVDYRSYNITTEDEQGIVLALRQRDRVYRVRLHVFVTKLQEFIMAMDGEYPILEYLVIIIPIDVRGSTILILPEPFQAPHLQHLMLVGFTLPIGSRLLTTAAGLVTLYLYMDHPSTYFHPNTLLQWLSFMPQLETLVIAFLFPVPNGVEWRLTHLPITTPVELPSLHHLWFQGVSAYLEALVHRITTPRLRKLQIRFRNQLTFPVPRLLQFTNTTENLRFDSANIEFFRAIVNVNFYSHEEPGVYPLSISVGCWHLNWQVSFATQISNSLRQMLSAVEHLVLGHEEHNLSSEEHNEVDRTEWRKLLRSFSNAKTLWIDEGLVEVLSRCLELEDGEPPLDLLPELQELTYSGTGDTSGVFASFIDARQNVEHPITLVRRSPNPSPPSSSVPITDANSKSGINLDT